MCGGVCRAAELTFRQVGAERRLRLLAVRHHLPGEEIYLCDLGGSQTLHPAPGKVQIRARVSVSSANMHSGSDLSRCGSKSNTILAISSLFVALFPPIMNKRKSGQRTPAQNQPAAAAQRGLCPTEAS